MKNKFLFLDGRFGMEPLFPIKDDEISTVHKYYRSFLDTSLHTLDDITWNDLDLDTIYRNMNATYSGAGDFMLYGMLRQPCLTNESLHQRLTVMNWARNEVEERDAVIHHLYGAGKRYEDDLEQPFQHDYSNSSRQYRSRALVYSMFISAAFAFLMPMPFAVIAGVLLIYNIFRSFILHKQLENEMDSLVYMLSHIETVHQLAAEPFTGLPGLKKHLEELSEAMHDVHARRSLDYFEKSSSTLNFLFQSESIYYDKYAKAIYERQDIVRDIFQTIGTLDACIAAASYQDYAHASDNVLLSEEGRFIDATDMIHPLLENPVSNHVDIHENRLITGSNATGKSTYLKMIAINAIFAQSFHFVFAKQYRASYFKIATSMTLHDDLFQNESTFVAEVKSLHSLLELCHDDIPALCMVDEILRGTNTLERIAASSAILHQFAQSNCICLGATHDIELTHILEKDYQNYHFTEKMEKDKMVFDYKIHRGPTSTRNAISLLKILGYQSDLIDQAKARLNHFEQQGEWETIAS